MMTKSPREQRMYARHTLGQELCDAIGAERIYGKDGVTILRAAIKVLERRDYLLGKEPPITLPKWIDKIPQSRAINLAYLRSSVEIMQTYRYALNPFGWHYSAVGLIDENDKCIAFIAYEATENDSVVWIRNGWCDPEHRGQGYYRHVWELLRDKFKDNLKFDRILSGASVENERSVSGQMSRGGVVDGVMTTYLLR